MAKNLTTKKVIQVFEESAPAMHIPLIVGNEIFVLTQQDIRRVEDIRLLSYNRLSTQGHLLTGSPLSLGFQDSCCDNSNPLISTPADLLVPLNADPSPVDPQLQFPNEFPQCCQEKTQHQVRFIDDELEIEPTRNVASVATQLGAKQVQTSSPFSLHYSVGTSTCGLPTHQNTNFQRTPLKECHHSSCQTDAITACVACNTDAIFQSDQLESGPKKCPSSKDNYPSHIGCRCCSLLAGMNKDSDPSTSHGNHYSHPNHFKVRISDTPSLELPNFNCSDYQNHQETQNDFQSKMA